jgi:branched-chain amino acid aminotransferase
MFRPEENAKRLQRSAKYLGIAAPSTELFIEMCERCIKENEEFLPPYEATGASLYLRPTLIGSNPQLGVQSSKESTFMVLCSPVGAYVGGALDAVDCVIARNYDRAAPNGSGSFKVGGNYACSLYSLNVAHEQGYKAVLYLDPSTKTKIDEFNSSNFFAIKDNRYITPKSDSILPSITNMSLETVAAHLGMEVERREVLVDELSTFEEVGECGTAVVITPVHKLVDKPFLESTEETVYTYGDGKCGPKSLRLYKFITELQKGDIEDPFGWVHFVE